jgi:hypothetical protein
VHQLRRAAAVISAATLSVLSLSLIDSGAAHAASVAGVAADIHISEAYPNGGKGGPANDYIELTNTGSSDEDISGWVLRDNKDSDDWTIDPGTVVPAGGYLAVPVDSSTHAGSFGLGSPADAARLYLPDGTTLVDQMYWNAANTVSGDGWSRCVSSAGVMGVVDAPATPGAANTCPTPAAVTTAITSTLKVNEVMADGATPTGGTQEPDWIELYNGGPTTLDVSGYYLSDNKATDKDVLPAGTYIAPGGFLEYGVGVAAGDPYAAQDPFIGVAGDTDFGLGKGGDNAALVFPNGTDVDRYAWTTQAWPTGATIGRNPDGGSTWQQTSTPTPGAANMFGDPADAAVKINEVDTADNHVELYNTGSASVDVSGLTIKNGAGTAYTIPASSSIAAGGFAAYDVSTAFTFASAGDSATLADGATTVDTTSWTGAQATSWGRCPDGTGAFAATKAATDGAANSCSTGGTTTPGTPGIRISEVETNGDPLGDWIELTNTSTAAIDISGWYIADDGGSTPSSAQLATFPTDSGHYWQIPAGTSIPAGGYLTIFSAYSSGTTYPPNTLLADPLPSGFGFGFGLGTPDEARIFDASKTLVDGTLWTPHESGATYQRCAGATQNVAFTDSADGVAFTNSSTSTPGAANDCMPPIRINEFDANGNNDGVGNDWVELTNIGTAPVDLNGWVLTDDKNSDGDTITAATPTFKGTLDTSKGDGSAYLAPGAYVAFAVDSTTAFPTPAAGTSGFGLGASGDEVRLYGPGAWTGGTTYDDGQQVDAIAWGSDVTTPAKNGVTASLPGFTSWPNTPVTWGRCSDGVSQVVANGTGAWAQNAAPTPAAANSCTGLVNPTPWPDTHHGQADTTADNVDLGQNMSGLFYVPGSTPAQDYMWGIQNGSSTLSGANPGDSGSLYKLVQDGSGNWGPATGWEKGVPVRYLDNATGEVDAEGVTAVGGQVFVTSERDNTNDLVSKIAVIQVDPTAITHSGHAAGDADGDLLATHEWDLGQELGPLDGNTQANPETGLDPNNPGDANLGLEGVAFVPDSYLVKAGFVDQSTGKAYDPADYPKHVEGGVFFAALEKTGKLYAYVFNSDNTFHRVATVNTGFPTIMDVTWDPSQDALWATCDNSCQGESSILKVDTMTGSPTQGTFQVAQVNERPTGATQNLNNEGFTVQPASECASGSRSAWWSDDTDDGGHWLRTAQVDCPTPVSGQVGATVSVSYTQQGTSTPAVKNAAGAYTTPVTATFTCVNGDAVLGQACPAPVDITTSQPATTVATLTDTLGKVYPAALPAITIATPSGPGGGTGGTGGGQTGGTGGNHTVTPVPVVVHKIAGVPKVGKKVTVKITVPHGATVTYQWFAGAKRIKHATKRSLKLTRQLRHKRIKVKVTVVEPGHAPVVKVIKLRKPVR